MKQILQTFSNGETQLEDLPCPAVKPGHVLIRTRASVISAGTERMILEFGKSSWLERARKHPDKVRQVLDKVRSDGLGPTLAAVRNKLDKATPIGYCNAGVVLEVGEGVTVFRPGQRVASNGAHAEVVSVPQNLVAVVPDEVQDESAAFTVLGAIALQGIRLTQPELGETVAVFGLGLLGQITVQLLRASGCRVVGIDLNAERCALARTFGAEVVDLSAGAEAVAAVEALTAGQGVDAAILTLATASNEPIHQAAQMCRQRGRVVLVGVTGLQLDRSDFYAKEIRFQVSCSYGPGRYDPEYEQDGRDYPRGFVRFTAQRNFEAVLETMARGGLDVNPLISHRIPFEDSEKGYALLDDPKALGIVLRYPGVEVRPDHAVIERIVERPRVPPLAKDGSPRVALIGAGSFGASVLVPALKEGGAELRTVVSETGVGASHSARKYGFAKLASEPAAAFEDPEIDAVVIATRHDSHAQLAVEALRAGKHVFVEKPLALTHGQLAEVQTASEESGAILTVGFNRRFAPQIVRMKELLRTEVGPKAMVMTVNAGSIPAEHWTQDSKAGGGRIVGEACHFLDLLIHLAGAEPIGLQVSGLRTPGQTHPTDTATLTLDFADGSTGTVHYFANGHRNLPKERLEVFCGGKVLSLDNFRVLQGYGWKGFSRMKLRRQDKGHSAGIAAFLEAVRTGGAPPIPRPELFASSRLAIEAAAFLMRGPSAFERGGSSLS